MSDRTWKRLVQFDDERAVNELYALPHRLVETAAKLPVDMSSAKIIRLALLLSLLLEVPTLRSGNVVALDLEQHFPSGSVFNDGNVHLMVAGEEIKNDLEFKDRLPKHVSDLLRLYIEKYRPVHMRTHCTWLFPRSDGSHWTQHQAYLDLTDICDKLLGLDVTPHLSRSIAGKIVLDQYPGGHAVVQQLLAHKSLLTTISFYAPVRASAARSLYHELLDRNIVQRPIR